MTYPPPPVTARAALSLPDPAATERLGAALAAALAPGDVVLLSGPLGAGKSALARAVIAARIGAVDAHIPSPSYTLVNVYDAPGGPIWHADLYRLAGDDLAELGLEEAYDDALVLIEWPERLGQAVPARHLALSLAADPSGGRVLSAQAAGQGWDAALAAIGGGA